MCRVHEFLRILDTHKEEYKHKKGTLTLVLSGYDQPHTSEIKPLIKQIKQSGWFHRVFYEGIDRRVPGISPYLKVFDQVYMLGMHNATSPYDSIYRFKAVPHLV